jgi:hypothetical protein
MCGSADVKKFDAYLYLGYYGGYCELKGVRYDRDEPETKEAFMKKLQELTLTDLQELIIGFVDNAQEA